MTFPNSSLNPTLNYLRQNSYIVTVAADGSGAYTSISEAIDAGHKRIFVKPGTYTISSSLSLSGVHLFGNSPKNTILNLGNNVSISLQTHTTSDSNHDGTATLTNDSTALGGAGTAWDTTLDTYDFPFFSIGRDYSQKTGFGPVESVTNDTTAVLPEKYEGVGTTDSCSVFDCLNFGSIISGFRIVDAATGGSNRPLLKVSGIHCLISGNYFVGTRSYTTNGIVCGPGDSPCISAQIIHNVFYSGQRGITIGSSKNSVISYNKFIHQQTASLDFGTTASNIAATGTRILANTIEGSPIGVYVRHASSAFTTVSGNLFTRISSQAIRIDEVNDTIISGNQIYDNAGDSYGIRVSNACDRIVISGNTVYAKYPVYIDSKPDARYFSVCNNIFQCSAGSVQTIILDGLQSVFSDNHFYQCLITAAWAECTFKGNSCVECKIDLSRSLDHPYGPWLDCGSYQSSITGNSFKSSSIYLTYGLDIVISGNSFYKYYTGSYTISTDGDSDHTLISNNTFRDCSGHGCLSILSSSVISSNIFSDADADFVFCAGDSVIANNLVDGADSYSGFAFQLSGNNLSVVGNRIYNWSDAHQPAFLLSNVPMKRLEFAHNFTDHIGVP